MHFLGCTETSQLVAAATHRAWCCRCKFCFSDFNQRRFAPFDRLRHAWAYCWAAAHPQRQQEWLHNQQRLKDQKKKKLEEAEERLFQKAKRMDSLDRGAVKH